MQKDLCHSEKQTPILNSFPLVKGKDEATNSSPSTRMSSSYVILGQPERLNRESTRGSGEKGLGDRGVDFNTLNPFSFKLSTFNSKGAFTLVELIVVITILAILGLISFIALQGFSAEARDSKRLSDIKSLISKITIEHTKGVPYSDLIDSTDETRGGKTNTGLVTINGVSGLTSHQGPANFTNLKENPNSFKDPLSTKDNPIDYIFAYITGEGYDFVQGATISEKNNNSAVVMGNYYTTDPDNDTKGIIFDENDEPLVNEGDGYVPPSGGTPPSIPECGEGYYLDNNNCIEVEAGYYSPQGTNEKTECPNGTYSSAGAGSCSACTNKPTYSEYTGNAGTNNCPFTCTDSYTGTNCEIPPPPTYTYSNGEITLSDGTNTYTIADRNLGATTVYNGETESTDVSTKIETWRGNHYQWGRDVGFSIATGTPNGSQSQINPINRNSNSYFIWNSSLSSNRHDWSTTQEDHLWGDTSTSNGTINGSQQGPCPSGRHVPSTSEWDGLFKVWCQYRGGSLEQCTVALGSSVNWSTLSGYNTNITLANFKSDLHLPFAGGRHRSIGSVVGQGSIYGSYWSSSPYSTNAHHLDFRSTSVGPQSNLIRAVGFSVRCFKN